MTSPIEIEPQKKDKARDGGQNRSQSGGESLDSQPGNERLVEPFLESRTGTNGMATPKGQGRNDNVPDGFPNPPLSDSAMDDDSQSSGSILQADPANSISAAVIDLPYGKEAELKSIVSKMTLFQAHDALQQIRNHLATSADIPQDLTGGEANDPNNPFVNLHNLYSPDLSGFDLQGLATGGSDLHKTNLRRTDLQEKLAQQGIDFLKIRQAQKQAGGNPSSAQNGVSNLEEMARQKEKLERDPFNLESMPSVSDSELQQQVDLGLTFAGATPEQKRQYEQRQAIERANREDPDLLGPLDVRLKVPEEKMTPQQRQIYDGYVKSQEMRKAHAIVAKHIEKLEAMRDQQARQRQAESSRQDFLPALSLFSDDKTPAQQALARLTERGLLGQQTKAYPNGLTVKPESDGAYAITLYNGDSEVYRIAKDGKTVRGELNPDFHAEEDSGAGAEDTVEVVGPGGKAVNVEADSDSAKSDVSPDGKIVRAEQNGKISVGKNGELILDLQKSEFFPMQKITIQPDGSVTKFMEYYPTDEDMPGRMVEYMEDRPAHGQWEQIRLLGVNGNEERINRTYKGLKPGRKIEALDGTLITFGNNSISAQRINDLAGSEIGSRVWNMDSFGNVTLDRNGSRFKVSMGKEANLTPDDAYNVDKVINQDDKDYSPTEISINQDNKKNKILNLELPEYHGAQLRIAADYDVNQNKLKAATITYVRAYKDKK